MVPKAHKRKKENINKIKIEKTELEKFVEKECQEELASTINEESLVTVNSDMIPTYIPLPCTIYIKVAGKFVLFRNQGERLSEQRIVALQVKGVDTLYIHKAFWKIFMDTIEKLELPDTVTEEKKAKHIKHILVAYGQELEKKLSKPKKPIFDKLKNYTEKVALSVIKERELGFKLIQKSTDTTIYFVNHSVNVAIYSCLIGIKMRLTQGEICLLTYSSLLHDIGKLYIPKRILYKNTPLTQEEELEVQTHTRRGAELLQSLGIVPNAVLTALQHHERYDGQGYPAGLEKEDIHLFSRICTIADTFDNLTSKKPNSEPVSAIEAIEMMKNMTGKFDTNLINQVNHQEFSSRDEKLKDPPNYAEEKNVA